MNEKVINILNLIKLDATQLKNRIIYRQNEYIHIFASKRTREHFQEIFKSRYDSFTASELSECPAQIMGYVDSFYEDVDNLKWYFNTTEDMPKTIETKLGAWLKSINSKYMDLTNAVEEFLNSQLDDFPVNINEVNENNTSEFD